MAAATLVRDQAAAPAVARAFAWAERNVAAITAEVTRISEIAAPTSEEAARAAYVLQRFRSLGLTDIHQDSMGNVYGRIAGRDGNGTAALALLAHLDTVFDRATDVTVRARDGRLYGPGIGDNAAGLGGLLAAAEALQQAHGIPQRSLWLVATTGEEGLGNLRGAHAATDELGASVEAMIAVEGSFYGRLSHVAVGSRRLEITCRGPGGHSWHDFGRPSATHILTRLSAAITRLPVPSEPRTTYNIGRIEGGGSVNVIAETARLLLDMRSIETRALDQLTNTVYATIRQHEEMGATVEAQEVGFRPAGAVPASHRLVSVCSEVLRWLGVAPVAAPASTDANVPISRGIPALTLGVTRGGGAHTTGEWIETAPLAKGVQQLVLVMMALADRRAAICGER